MEVQVQKFLLKPFQKVLALDEVWDHAVKKGIHVHDNGLCWKENITYGFFPFCIFDLRKMAERIQKGMVMNFQKSST